MKHYYFYIIFLAIQLYNSNGVFGQSDVRSDVTTPKNSPVEAWITSEDNPTTRGAYDATYTTSSRTLIQYFNDGYSSSRRFNCHGYAWHMVEGGAAIWIGYSVTTNEDIYMADGSYIQVCNETYPGKVSWADGDYSAITTQTLGVWTSKWNKYPLMTHNKNDNPFGSVFKYYVSTKISGSTSNLCSGTRLFSVQNISGATYVWTYSSALAVVGSINTSQITIQKNGSTTGAAWVSVQISTPCSATPVNSRQDFTIGTTPVELNDITVRYTRNQGSLQTVDFGTINNKTIYTQTGSFSVIASTNLTGTNTFNWVVTGPPPGSGYGWSNFTKSGGNCSFTLSGTNAPTIPLQVTLTNTQNGCTTSATNNKIVVFVGSIPGAAMAAFDVSPNPASTTFNISPVDNTNQLSSSAKNTSTPSIKEIRLIDKMGNIKLTKRYADDLTKTDRINIAGLPNDIYTLMIFNGTDWEAHKIVKQ